MPKTDDETRREIFQMIGAAYPRFPFPEATIALYVSQLEDVSTDVLREAVTALIRREGDFPPTLGAIVGEIVDAKMELLGLPSAEGAFMGECQTEFAMQLWEEARIQSGLAAHYETGLVKDRPFVEARCERIWKEMVERVKADIQAGRKPTLLAEAQEEALRLEFGGNEGMHQIGEGVALRKLLAKAKERSAESLNTGGEG